jgi:hypothetical protein
MLSPDRMMRVTIEALFVALGALVVWLGATRHIFFNRSSLGWLGVAVLLILSRVPVGWVAPTLAGTGAVLAMRGLIGAVLILRAS